MWSCHVGNSWLHSWLLSWNTQRWAIGRLSKYINYANKELIDLNRNKYFKVTSIRLCRFLYSLGFNKMSAFNKNNNENWLFEKSDELQESLDFYFYMRNKNRNK